VTTGNSGALNLVESLGPVHACHGLNSFVVSYVNHCGQFKCPLAHGISVVFVEKAAVMGKFSMRHVAYVLDCIRKLDENIGREGFLHEVPGT
jgi:hypothetical protein